MFSSTFHSILLPFISLKSLGFFLILDFKSFYSFLNLSARFQNLEEHLWCTLQPNLDLQHLVKVSYVSSSSGQGKVNDLLMLVLPGNANAACLAFMQSTATKTGAYVRFISKPSQNTFCVQEGQQLSQRGERLERYQNVKCTVDFIFILESYLFQHC